MLTITSIVPENELAADKAAVASTSFCTLWPAGRQALVALTSVVNSTLVKFAINTVLAAGDAYCGKPQVTAAGVLSQLKSAGVNSLDDLADQIARKQTAEVAPLDWIMHSDVVLQG